MRSYPRIRKTVKWASAVMVVVLTVAWAVSLRWNIAYKERTWAIALPQHSVGAMSFTDPFIIQVYEATGLGWQVATSMHVDLRGLWFRVLRNRGFNSVSIPLWVPILLSGGVFFLSHRFDLRCLRIDQGRCVKCGYDRAGLKDAGAACPECGTIPPPPHRPASSS